MHQVLETLRDAGAGVFIAWLLERPIDEHGTTDDVFVRHKSPIAAVEADVAIVAHGKNAVRRNHQLAILEVRGKRVAPGRVQAVVIGRWNGREVIAIAVVGSVADDEGRFELLAVAINDAVLKLDAVTRYSDDALHDVQTGLGRRNEDKDVVMPRVAIGNQRANPFRT